MTADTVARVIAVLNCKGGTGKTTTVVNLAAGLALAGRRVLAVDLDPQSGLAASFGTESQYSLAELLLAEAAPRQVIVSARPGIDLITSTARLAQLEQALWRFNAQRRVNARLMAQRLPVTGDYDYVLLDCSPSLSHLNESALVYASEVFVPVSMDYLSLVGVKQVFHLIDATSRTYERAAGVSLIIPTFYDHSQRKSHEVMDILRRHFPDRLAGPIRCSERLSEAPSYQEHIYEYDPRSTGAQDYARLVQQVMDGR